ncbi:MAG: DUF4783 domain-containing protein [Bacteroidetes bacterium]|nr:DUF4783 domain-containing protein [Bacteroidota bacterium]
MKRLTSILLLIAFTAQVFAMDVFDDIAFSIRSGDARQLATFFGPTIDLTILSQEDVYSKVQAEQVIKDFFSKNPPKSFDIIHKGASPEGTQYAIGTLVTTTGKKFRTSFYVKNTGGKNILQELRIETE